MQAHVNEQRETFSRGTVFLFLITSIVLDLLILAIPIFVFATWSMEGLGLILTVVPFFSTGPQSAAADHCSWLIKTTGPEC